jgi:hypothetical protein
MRAVQSDVSDPGNDGVMKLRSIAIAIAIASGSGLLIASQDDGRDVRYGGVVGDRKIVAEVTGDGRTVAGVPCDTATGAGFEDTPDWCLRPLVETFHGGDIEPGP